MYKNILFIVNMDESNKGGLFNATHQRIKSISHLLNKFEIYSLCYYDGFLIRGIKKLLGKKVYEKKGKNFLYEGINYNYLYLRTSIFQKLFPNFHLTIFFIFYILINRSKIRDFNIVSAHWGYPQGIFAYYINKLLSIPYTLTLHGSDIHTIPNFDNRIKKLTLKALENSNNNFFVSKNLLNSATNLGYKKNNYSILYNGIDLSLFKSFNKKQNVELKRQLRLNGKVVGFIGSLIEIKRADKLGTIFKHIKDEMGNDVSFLVVGEGKLMKEIQKESQEHQLSINFTGNVQPEEVPKYINIMDILILPSKNEGFGNVVIEANACGVLAIGSDNGGIPEAIGNSGYLVNDGENFEKRFALKVTEFLRYDYDKESLVKRVHEHFSIKKVGIKEADKYDEIIWKLNDGELTK